MSVEPYSAEPQSVEPQSVRLLKKERNYLRKQLRKVEKKLRKYRNSKLDVQANSHSEIVLFKRGCECPCLYGSMGVMGFEQIQACCKNPPTKKALLKMQRDDLKLVKLIRELFAHPDYKEELFWCFHIVTVETKNRQKPLFKIVMDSDDIETLVLFNGKIVKEEFI